ncbi:MAG: hypothetical protein HKN84_02190, partial [Gammaproteobacteria bacterium]|nr:hypothetical protein [Gammaproteobacteria bacterium]
MTRTNAPVLKLLVLTALPLLAPPASAQGLPPGDGIEVLAVSCTQCHSLDRLAKV